MSIEGRSPTADEVKADLLRAFVLACSLEPLAAKPGCTTRHVDSSPGTKLEYFTVAAMNSGSTLLQVVDRAFAIGRQPEVIFDLAYAAQVESVRSRLGGKVNYAQILMLLPVILGHVLLVLEGSQSINAAAILNRGSDAMRHTSALDVQHLQAFVDLASSQSAAHNLRIGTRRSQLSPNFVRTCRSIMDAVHVADFAHTMMATELRDAYPVSLGVYRELTRHGGDGILRQSERVYGDLLPQLMRPDVVADVLVVGLYLMIVLHPREILFP